MLSVQLTPTFTPPTPARTPENRANSLMRLLSRQYAALTFDQIALWNLVNNPIQTPGVPVPAHPTRIGINGWTAFYACNALLYQTGQSLVSSPVPVNKPANLPLLRAAITGDGDAPTILLRPQSDAAYPAGPLLAVWASQPVPPGNGQSAPDKWRAKSYFFLGTVSGGLPLEGINVASLYAHILGAVPSCCKIGLKVIAINPGGWHSEPAYTFGQTPLLSLSATLPGDTDLKLASGE